MKNLLLIIGLAISTLSFGQKNEKFVSGTVSYSTTTGEKSTYTVEPTIGYFVTNRVAVGVLGEFEESAGTKTTSAGVFGRCHFLQIGKHCTAFSQLEILGNKTETAGSADVKTTNINLGIGANYELTKKLGLTARLTNLATYQTGDGVSTFTVGLGEISNPISAAKFGLIYTF